MAKPRLTRISEEIARRLARINGADPFYSDIGSNVQRGRTEFNELEVPFVSCFLSVRTIGETHRQRSFMVQTITIHARSECGDRVPEDVGAEMLDDIQATVETADRTLGGLVLESMQWESDEIFYPDPHRNLVAVETRYSIPQMRKWGDP